MATQQMQSLQRSSLHRGRIPEVHQQKDLLFEQDPLDPSLATSVDLAKLQRVVEGLVIIGLLTFVIMNSARW